MGNVNTTSHTEISDTIGDGAKDASTNLGRQDEAKHDTNRGDNKSFRITRNATYTTHDDTGSLCTYNTSHTNATPVSYGQQNVHQNNFIPQDPASVLSTSRSNQERGQLLQKIKRQQAQARHMQSSRSGESAHAAQQHQPDAPIHDSSTRLVGVMYASPASSGEITGQVGRGYQHQHQRQPQDQTVTRTNRARTRSIKKGPLEEEDWKQNWDNDCDSSDEEEDVSSRSVGGGIGPSELSPGHFQHRSARANNYDLTKQVDAALKGEGAVDWETTSGSARGGGAVPDKPELGMFSQLRVLGKGSFGKVVLVQKRKGNEKGGLFAMKTLRKTHLLKRGQIERTRTERKVLSVVDHPFIMKLHFAFQTDDKLFLVLDYCAGGELFFHLSRHRRFPEKYTRFYAAELLLALKYLHSKGIIYRDLKPENVLLDSEGHVKLGDFGLAKANISHYYKGTRSRVGTPEYMSPEVLQKWGHGFCVDFWGLGMLTYEMMTGLPPWYTTNRHELLKNLIRAPLQIPPYFSPQARSFVSSLLERDPKKRLGVRGAHSAISHEFFRRLDFKALEGRRIEAPILPCEGWKSPEPQQAKMGAVKRGLFGGMAMGGSRQNSSAAASSTKIQSLHSDDLDAATANFDKQFTRMALDSHTSHEYSDDYSEDDYDGQELNENTFIGFTFDDPSSDTGDHQ